MNRLVYMTRLVVSVLKSRGFAVAVLMVLMSLTVYAVSATSNTVYVRADGTSQVYNTSARELPAILEDCGIHVSPYDDVNFSGFEGNVAQIEITRGFPVAIRVDKSTYQVMMTGGTVADALTLAGVSIDDDDLISQPLYDFVEEYDRIFINRIDYQMTVYEEEIPYEVETRVTSLLRNGKTRLLQAGENGSKLLTYGETTKDGYVQEAELLGENITKRPTTQITLVGGNAAVSPYDFGYQIVGNAPATYKQVLTGVKATGYSGLGRSWVKGASGNALSAGHVAVNPNIIPYNSKLYITSADGSFIYGYAIASDTGTGLMDGTVGVDLFYDSYLESVLNSVRTVNIYVLE